MILVSYDGSADARAAIDRVAQLMPGAEVTVLTVWEPFLDMLAHSGSIGIGMTPAYVDGAEIDRVSRETALVTATEGAARATTAGLVGLPRSEQGHGGTANAVLAAAGDLDADLVVMGTRGLSGVKSFLLGSVSHAVVQHADRAVLVVPSPTLAERRTARIERATTPA